MMYAYNENYLDDAMKNLGEALDYAVNMCHLDADEFMKLFISTGFADSFGKGHPNIVAGRSGTELVMEVLTAHGHYEDFPPAQIEYDCAPEYWCGWILAYYQWFSGKSFREIHRYISMKEILKLYPTLHEASEEKFVDVVNNIITRKITLN